ncbi:MAG: thioredoxin [Clostridia bacterium]|nr:thioredoxin [Clostridia bacterium]
MAVIKVTQDNFKEEVLESSVPVLADFNATWCGPCRMLAPVIEEIADERNDIKVVAIDVDEESDLASDHDVFSIPCVVLFKGGAEAARSVGFKSKDDLLDMVDGN